MSRKIDRAVRDCVDSLKSFEESLAKRGFTLDEWLSDPDIRSGKKKTKEPEKCADVQ